MRIIIKKIKVYKFHELSMKAKSKAVNDYVNLLTYMYDSNQLDESENFVKEAYEKAEELKTPWFFGSIVYELGRDQILEKLSQEEFLLSGEVFLND